MQTTVECLKFKELQTAAAYVACGLEEVVQEEFELHLMGCPGCVDDVEVWRCIKQEMPREGVQTARSRQVLFPLTDWRMAASLVGVGVLGALGGWAGKALTVADLTSNQTMIFNLPNTTRGAGDCTLLKLSHQTRQALIRISGLARDSRLVALDAEHRELPAASHTQMDGSRILTLDSSWLTPAGVILEAHEGDGDTAQPLGCLRGELP